MTTHRMARADVLYWIRQDLDRAYQDAEHRLTQDEYFIHDGLFTVVEVKAHSGDGQKISKYHKVGDAINYRTWEADDE